MADRVGQQLGKYRLIRLLGQGGFAEVYLGEHVRLGTHTAVKVLYTRLAKSDEVENFQKEARTIAHLEHPHIVRVFDFDVVDNTPFLVMNYAPNGSLRQRHPKGTILPLKTIVSYTKQIADALQYAHDQRLVHRDIKPENMLLGRRDELLLSDFGIAILAQSSRYQSTQDMAGTMAYMAPEQIQGHPRPASDQYSLGIVVYEWLCGDRPFHGSMTEIVAQHLAVPPPPLRAKVSAISLDMEQVVMTALAKDPKARFSSVQAFATALEQVWLPEQAFGAAATFRSASPSVHPTKEIQDPNFLSTHPTTPDKEMKRQDVPSPDSIPASVTPTPDMVSAPLASELFSTPEPLPSLLPPLGTTNVILPAQPLELSPMTKSDTVGAENHNERMKVWHLGKRQYIAIFLSVLLIICVSALGGWYSAGPDGGAITPFDVIMSIILLLVFVVIPPFFGATFGPWVGLFAGGIDIFLGLFVYVFVFNTRRGFGFSYCLQQYSFILSVPFLVLVAPAKC